MDCNNLLETIGHNIARARRKKEMKGETLARHLGVSKSAISQLENGLVDVKVSTLHKIADYLDVDVCSLVATQFIHSEKEARKVESSEQAVLIDMAVVQQLISRIDMLNAEIRQIKTG